MRRAGRWRPDGRRAPPDAAAAFFCEVVQDSCFRLRRGGGDRLCPAPAMAELDARKRGSAALLERLPLARDRPAFALFLTVAIALAALAIRYAADGVLPPGFPFLSFFPAVIVSAFLFGVRFGALSALICGIFAWLFFLPGAPFAIGIGGVLALTFYGFIVITDILLVHWMQAANRRVAAERERNRGLAETRELLFRELQHRVSNNLQVTAALLTLQKRHVADEGARAALGEASRRIGVIGRISRQLYDTDGGARRLEELMVPICRDVIDASGKQVTLTVRDEGWSLAPDVAVPVALIVAEAVANAIEHGFDGRAAGRIALSSLRDADGGLVIEVQDDGHGLPAGFDAAAGFSLGLRIATMLAGQLGGSFDMIAGAGATARLRIPAAAGRLP